MTQLKLLKYIPGKKTTSVVTCFIMKQNVGKRNNA